MALVDKTAKADTGSKSFNLDTESTNYLPAVYDFTKLSVDGFLRNKEINKMGEMQANTGYNYAVGRPNDNISTSLGSLLTSNSVIPIVAILGAILLIK